MHTTQSTCRFVLTLIFWCAFSLVSTWAENQSTSPEKEKAAIAVLRSDASPAEKALACKKLAIDGSVEALPDLAKLLPDPQLSSWARIALEAIPGPQVDQTLREAANSIDGILLVGIINSIGVRQDPEAVDALTQHLQDKNPEVAAAAAVALGRIGNANATNSLRQAFTAASANVRSAVAEGYLLCAERLHAAGEPQAATKIYDEIRGADLPKQRIIEATRGAILARNEEGIPLLLETFRSPDKKMFQLALGTAREFPGSAVDEALAAELPNSTPPRAALMIQAMADRPETVMLAAVLKAADQGDPQVRMSAINALQRVGDPSCISVLLKTADGDDTELANAARQTLAALPGANVNTQIVAMLPGLKGERYALLLRLIGKRRIDAVNEVIQALDDSDSEVRSAAFYALGETINLDKLPVLIAQVVRPKTSQDAEKAEQALMVASIRMPDREACTAVLASTMNRASSGTKSTLLEIVGAVGGNNALKTLAAAAKSNDPEHQDISSRLLGKWNSVDAAPVLLDLATTAPAEKYQIRALRGYIGIARKFPMPEQERVEMCRKAIDASSRTAEQQLVLDVLKIHPSQDGLNLTIKAKQIPQLSKEAEAAAQFIQQKLGK